MTGADSYGSVESDRFASVAIHELIEITCPPGAGCAALCSCGWESTYYPSAGMAGSVWDAHVEAAAEAE